MSKKEKTKAKELLFLIKMQMIEHRSFSCAEFNKNIANFLDLDEKNFALSVHKYSSTDNLASLPVMILSLIRDGMYSNDKELYTNEFLFNLIEQYDVHHLLGKCLSANRSNLLGVCISYNNLEFFNYLMDNHINQMNINHQNNDGDTILHSIHKLDDKEFEPYLKRILNCPNLNTTIKNVDDDLAYDLYSETKKSYIEKLYLNEIVINNLKENKGKIKL